MVVIWKELFDELLWLRLKWQNYKVLYSNPANVEVLNESAGTFFGICQLVFFDDAITALCRITDPETSCGRPNISLKRLLAEVDQSAHGKLFCDADKLLSSIEVRMVLLRHHRNKRISHNDYYTAVNPSVNPIPGISRQNISELLDEIHDFLELFDIEFNQSITAKTVACPFDGADKLLRYLQKACELRKKDNYKFIMDAD